MGGSKEHQHKVAIPAKRRGQEMGFGGNPDRNREIVRDTPAVRGGLKKTAKIFADPSSQQIGSSSTTPSTNSPSAPAQRTGGHPGETAGEATFKRRLAGQRSVMKTRRR
jgi:hypothetical protein